MRHNPQLPLQLRRIFPLSGAPDLPQPQRIKRRFLGWVAAVSRPNLLDPDRAHDCSAFDSAAGAVASSAGSSCPSPAGGAAETSVPSAPVRGGAPVVF